MDIVGAINHNLNAAGLRSRVRIVGDRAEAQILVPTYPRPTVIAGVAHVHEIYPTVGATKLKGKIGTAVKKGVKKAAQSRAVKGLMKVAKPLASSMVPGAGAALTAASSLHKVAKSLNKKAKAGNSLAAAKLKAPLKLAPASGKGIPLITSKPAAKPLLSSKTSALSAKKTKPIVARKITVKPVNAPKKAAPLQRSSTAKKPVAKLAPKVAPKLAAKPKPAAKGSALARLTAQKQPSALSALRKSTANAPTPRAEDTLLQQGGGGAWEDFGEEASEEPGDAFDEPGESFDEPGADFDGESFDEPADEPGDAFDEPGADFDGESFDEPADEPGDGFDASSEEEQEALDLTSSEAPEEDMIAGEYLVRSPSGRTMRVRLP